MRIWKFELAITDQQDKMLPEGAEILSVGKQYNSLYFWALVNPDNPNEIRHFEVIGTGNHFYVEGIERKFLGTVVIDPYVWHIFERMKWTMEVR